MADISGLLITGLLAILGTVIGNLINGYWSTRLAHKDFQSKLILKAMEANDSKVRAKSLEFLAKINLIDDPKIRQGVQQILDSGELDLIPQFGHSEIRQTEKVGVTEMTSAKGQVLEKEQQAGNPLTGDSTFLALTGFIVRHGDVIDGFTPIFSEIDKTTKQFKAKRVGKHFGGQGGSPTEIYNEGYIITGIDLIRGMYFGREEVAHLQVIWHRLTPQGIDTTDKIESIKLGNGEFVKFDNGITSRTFRTQSKHYISDFSAQQSYHSDGSMFIHDMNIQEMELLA